MRREPRVGPVEGDAFDVLVATDLPVRGPAAAIARQMGEAVRMVLDDRRWRAGERRVGHLPGDYSSESPGSSREEQAAANAAAMAADERVLGVIGPLNSNAATAALPILAHAGVALVSPANTYVGLTGAGPTYLDDEPARYAADGRRAFLRVFPGDYHQAAAIAELAGGDAPLTVLHDGEPYGRSIADGLTRVANVEASEAWDADGALDAQLHRVAGRRPAALVLAGVPFGAAPALLSAARQALGDVPILVSDAFVEHPLGGQGEGLLAVLPGARPGALGPAGEAVVDALAARIGCERGAVEPYAVHAAQAAELLLDAIAASDGSRPDVVRRLFASRPAKGPLAPFAFTESGDPLPEEGSDICAFSVYRYDGDGGRSLVRTLRPSADVIRTALAV